MISNFTHVGRFDTKKNLDDVDFAAFGFIGLLSCAWWLNLYSITNEMQL
jgi:hypothetical protein